MLASPFEQSSASAVLQRVQAALSTLSPAEQRVGRLLLADPDTFVARPVGALSLDAHVSKPTVVRFCRSVGCEGLLDLKHRLRTHAREGVTLIHPCVNLGDSPQSLCVKVIDNAVAAILHHRHRVCIRTLERVTRQLIQGKEAGARLELLGLGTSGLVAQDAQRKFSRLGIRASAHSDVVFQAMNVALLVPGDSLLVISNSGRSREMLELAVLAKQNGASVVAITASNSPLARCADFHLAADHAESYESYEPMVSRLIHLLVVDVLATSLAMGMAYDKLEPLLQRAKRSLRNKV